MMPRLEIKPDEGASVAARAFVADLTAYESSVPGYFTLVLSREDFIGGTRLNREGATALRDALDTFIKEQTR